MREGFYKIKKALFGVEQATQSSSKMISAAYIRAKAKVEELEAELRRLDAQRDAIAAQKVEELKFLPYSSAELNEAVEKLLAADKAYRKLGTSIEKTETKLSRYRIKMQVVSEMTRKAGVNAQKARFGFNELRKSTIPLSKSILTTANMFKLMALRMVMRAAINAVKKGFQDLALYSDSFNNSMSDLSTSFLQVRNALSTAFAPVLQSLTPVIVNITDAFIEAMNTVSAFNARLFGGNATYLKAKKAQVDYRKSIEDTTKAMKGQLASFDQLNVISQSADESTAGAPTADQMFEEAEIPIEILAFADSIKQHLDDILMVVRDIGIALLAWKVGSAFGLSLSNLLFIVTAIVGAVKFISGIIEMWNNGIDWDNLTQTLIGLGAVVLGVAGLFGLTAGVVALLVGGIALLVTGIKDWINAGKLSEETFWSLEAAIVAVGVALAVLIGWPALVVAAIVAAALAIYKYWDEIKAFFVGIWDWFKNAIDKALERHEKAWNEFISFIVGIWDGIKSAFGNVADWFKNTFSKAWEGIKTAWSGAKSFFAGIWDGIKSAFGSVADWFKNTFSKAWEGVKNVFSTGGKIFSGIKEGIANVFKTVVNGIISGINTIIASPFNTINGLLNKIRGIEVFGIAPFKGLWNENPLPVPQIPKLARGAIIDAPTVAMIGERGREAVIPLENNTAWMDILAEKLASRLNFASIDGQPGDVYVYIGNDQLEPYIVRARRRQSIKTNGR